ncbi:MAG: hypothetical protein GY711_11035 [bacterium]|nr:hypothetical protein [bacterium]
MAALQMLASLALLTPPLQEAPYPIPTELFDAPTTIARALARMAPAAPVSAEAVSLSTLPLNVGIEADMPRDVAITPDGATVLVACRDTDNVEFYDLASGTWLASVDVGAGPLDVAVAPDGTTAVVPCSRDDSVTVIDLSTRTVLGSVAVTGSEPYRVEITSDSQRAIVGVVDGGIDSRISVIDLASLTEQASFPTVSQSPRGGAGDPARGIVRAHLADLALTPDDTRVVVPDYFGSRVAVYDVATGAALALLMGGGGPTNVDVSADGTTAVVAYRNGLGGPPDTVGKIDLGSLTLTLFDSGSSTFLPDVRITPDKRFAILNTQAGIEFVDLTTGAVSGSPFGESIATIQLSFDGRYAIAYGVNGHVIDIPTQTLVANLFEMSYLDAAASPIDHVVVAAHNLYHERVTAFATDGASAAALWTRTVGRPLEFDAPSTVAVTSDSIAVVTGAISGHAAVVDLTTESVLGYAVTGPSPGPIAVRPQGDLAVVATNDGDTVSIIDIASAQTLTEVAIGHFPNGLRIAPDGQTAYVLSHEGPFNRISYVDLAGAASSVIAQFGIGAGTVFQGLELAPDGATLAVLSPQAREVLIIDVATQAIAATLPVGAQPVRSVFSSDSSRLYVANIFDSTVSVIDVQGAASSVVTTLPVGWAHTMTLDASDRYLYLVARTGASPSFALELVVVDTTNLQTVATLPLPSTSSVFVPPHLAGRLGDQLVVALAGGDVVRVDMAGPQAAIVESIAPSDTPSDLAIAGDVGLAVLTLPGAADALDLIRFGGDSTPYCTPAVPNSTGQAATLRAYGTFLAGEQPLRLESRELPPNTFGYFLVSQTTGMVQPPGSQGNLCLAGSIGRYAQDVASSGPAGTLTLAVDTSALPLTPPVAVAQGEVWNFQCWFRDQNPAQTSNFSSAVSVAFE